MLDTKQFGKELKNLGFDFYSGVPCSFLKYLINYAINECEYVGAANEGDAVAIASGAYIGGRKSVVLMQNSGLTNAVSPLTSLNYPFRLPVLGFVSLRGEVGIPDEPQHELTGKITTQLLELMNVKWEYLSPDIEVAKYQLKEADRYITDHQPFFFVVKKGTFAKESLIQDASPPKVRQKIVHGNGQDQKPSRYEALQTINKLKDSNTVLLATTGKTGRELYHIEDAPNHLYMVGSMGCVSSLGLGLALSRKDKNIIILDGDGSILMRMGNLATIGYKQPSNILHILMDNHTHDSTGGQSTVSANVNFVNLAAANGYGKSEHVYDLHGLKAAIQKWKKTRELTFLYFKIVQGSKEGLGRPKIKPHEVKERLQKFLGR